MSRLARYLERREIAELERGFHSSSLFTVTTAPYIHGVARRV